MRKILLRSFVALVCLNVVGVVFFPQYSPIIYRPRQNNGRPDYEERFRIALARDTGGGRKSAEKVYHSVIGAASPARNCPRLFVRDGDSPRLKARAFVAMGVMRSYHGKKAAALAAFQEGVRRETNDATIQFYLGYGFAQIGRKEAAEAAFRRATVLGDGIVKKDAEIALQSLHSNE